MGTSEIQDSSVNVEEIMKKIRENIKRRKVSEVYGEAESLAASGSNGKHKALSPGDEIHNDLAYINSNWDIQNNSYFISTHRRVTGKALIKGRELVHGETRRYVDPMIWKQKEFNERIARVLDETTKNIKELYVSIKKIEGSIDQVQNSVSAQIEKQVREVIATVNEDIENKAWLAGILERRIANTRSISPKLSEGQGDGINYFVFEDRFRGSRTDIKDRQYAFIKYFAECRKVLDIGCGRGEFLELLKEHGIEGFGIDSDEDMVNFCKIHGLNAEKIDAQSYLEKLEDKSLDGIFMGQIVEHLEPNSLISILGLCFQKLIYGGTIIIETVNPLSFFSFANFYIDMSHKRPVHPQTLKFLLEAAGLRGIEIIFSSPVADDMKLRKIEKNCSEKEAKHVDIYNHNIDMINTILYGPQDYFVVSRK